MDMTTTLEAPATDPNYLLDIEAGEGDNLITKTLDLASVPMDIRVQLLKTAAKAYVHNRVSTAQAKTAKANAEWTSYEAAMQANPLQEIVAMPTTPKAVTDFAGIVDGAINALLSGQLGKRGGGTGKKPKELRNPIITQVTRAVVAKVYADNLKLDPAYKYPTAQKEVGSDGYEYLNRVKLPEWLAAGGTEESFNKVVDTKYTKPARLMLGLDKPKSLADLPNDIL